MATKYFSFSFFLTLVWGGGLFSKGEGPDLRGLRIILRVIFIDRSKIKLRSKIHIFSNYPLLTARETLSGLGKFRHFSTLFCYPRNLDK